MRAFAIDSVMSPMRRVYDQRLPEARVRLLSAHSSFEIKRFAAARFIHSARHESFSRAMTLSHASTNSCLASSVVAPLS